MRLLCGEQCFETYRAHLWAHVHPVVYARRIGCTQNAAAARRPIVVFEAPRCRARNAAGHRRARWNSICRRLAVFLGQVRRWGKKHVQSLDVMPMGHERPRATRTAVDFWRFPLYAPALKA
jgi:hypothetical protein